MLYPGGDDGSAQVEAVALGVNGQDDACCNKNASSTKVQGFSYSRLQWVYLRLEGPECWALDLFTKLVIHEWL